MQCDYAEVETIIPAHWEHGPGDDDPHHDMPNSWRTGAWDLPDGDDASEDLQKTSSDYFNPKRRAEDQYTSAVLAAASSRSIAPIDPSALAGLPKKSARAENSTRGAPEESKSEASRCVAAMPAPATSSTAAPLTTGPATHAANFEDRLPSGFPENAADVYSTPGLTVVADAVPADVAEPEAAEDLTKPKSLEDAACAAQVAPAAGLTPRETELMGETDAAALEAAALAELEALIAEGVLPPEAAPLQEPAVQMEASLRCRLRVALEEAASSQTLRSAIDQAPLTDAPNAATPEAVQHAEGAPLAELPEATMPKAVELAEASPLSARNDVALSESLPITEPGHLAEARAIDAQSSHPFPEAEAAQTSPSSPLPLGIITRGAKSAISSRVMAYQAACQSTPDKVARAVPSSPRGVGKPQSVALIRTRTSSLWPTRKLTDIFVQHVLKSGIVKLNESTSWKTGLEISEMPRLDDGRQQLLGSRFLTRLLSGEVELKACAESEAASAQSDLRHLRAEQLVAIRSKTLDLATESASHNARTNFLETVDRHLFEKITRQCLDGALVSLPAKPEVLHVLGLRVMLLLGAIELLTSQTGKANGGTNSELPPVPNCWALRLEEADWPEKCRVALFHARELRLQPLLGEHPDFVSPASGELVAIVRDQSSGVGKDRMLHWEIAIVDPKSADVLEEMEKFESKVVGKEMAGELAEVLAQRSRVFAVE